jgi:hypothetical protein
MIDGRLDRIVRCGSRRVIAGLTVAAMVCTPLSAWADRLPPPDRVFVPAPLKEAAVLRGVRFVGGDAERIEFMFDPKAERFTARAASEDVRRQSRYFMAALSIPEEDLWVDLSPDTEKDAMPYDLEGTALGQDMLAQDYLLKQTVASSLDPCSATGKTYWARHDRAMGRVWVVPGSAVLRETVDGVVIEQARLALKAEENGVVDDGVLASVERVVNESSDFVPLRQMYHAFLLASWCRDARKDHPYVRAYAGSRVTDGIDGGDMRRDALVRGDYRTSFEHGVFSRVVPQGGKTVKRYVSGGVRWVKPSEYVLRSRTDEDVVSSAMFVVPMRVVRQKTDVSLTSSSIWERVDRKYIEESRNAGKGGMLPFFIEGAYFAACATFFAALYFGYAWALPWPALILCAPILPGALICFSLRADRERGNILSRTTYLRAYVEDASVALTADKNLRAMRREGKRVTTVLAVDFLRSLDEIAELFEKKAPVLFDVQSLDMSSHLLATKSGKAFLSRWGFEYRESTILPHERRLLAQMNPKLIKKQTAVWAALPVLPSAQAQAAGGDTPQRALTDPTYRRTLSLAIAQIDAIEARDDLSRSQKDALIRKIVFGTSGRTAVDEVGGISFAAAPDSFAAGDIVGARPYVLEPTGAASRATAGF